MADYLTANRPIPDRCPTCGRATLLEAGSWGMSNLETCPSCGGPAILSISQPNRWVYAPLGHPRPADNPVQHRVFVPETLAELNELMFEPGDVVLVARICAAQRRKKVS